MCCFTFDCLLKICIVYVIIAHSGETFVCLLKICIVYVIIAHCGEKLIKH